MSIFIETLKGNKTKTPIWLMRQAGRHLPEYIKVRQKYKDLMEMFLDPDRSLYRALGLPRSVSKVRQYFFLQFVQCPIRISNLKTTCFSL